MSGMLPMPKKMPKKMLKKVSKKKKNKIGFAASVKMILSLITRRDRVILAFLLLATFFLTLIETFGVSVIMPFVTLATNPDLIMQSRTASAIYNFFHFDTPVHFMLFFCVILIFFYVFRAVYNILYNYALNRFVYHKYHYFSYQIFCNTIRSDYEAFARKNMDDIRKGIISESLQASQFLSSFLSIFAEISVMCILYIILLFISWKMTLILTFLLSINILLIVKGVGHVMDKQGQVRQESDRRFFKLISQSLGNFKIVKLMAMEDENFQKFEKESLKRSKAQTLFHIFLILPRNILETMGFCILVACVGYILYFYGDAKAVLPIVSMFTLALYRVLPSVSKVLDNYNTMLFNAKAVQIIYDNLQEDVVIEGDKKIKFEKEIEVSKISFAYKKGRNVFKDYNLKIKKGEKIAFVGKSGAGKSTLIDLIIGILKPKRGKILIDGVPLDLNNIRSWRSKIGYIPQSIYLFDGSVGENIAFGQAIKKKRLIEVTKMANIYDFLQENGGFNMRVGDGGINLSGGQKQRIGIARALYHNPDIIVLDEATSALDTETESRIMDEIYQITRDKTLLVIAHRLSTVERCDRKVVVSAMPRVRKKSSPDEPPASS